MIVRHWPKSATCIYSMYCAPCLCYKCTASVDSRSCPAPSGKFCWGLVPMLCSEHPWTPWAVGSCHQQTPTLPLLLLIFFPFAPGILSFLPSLTNKPRKYKATSEKDLTQQRLLQSNMLWMREEWLSLILGKDNSQNWSETGGPPCKTISISFQTLTSVSERFHSLLNIRVYTEIL